MLRALPFERKLSLSGLRSLVRPLLLAALMFFAMRAELLLRASPLAAALMAAGLAAGESPAALVAGCLLGMLHFPLTEISLLPPLSCAGVLALELLWPLVKPLGRVALETRVSLIAGLGALLPPLIQARGAYLASAQALACGCLAAAAAPFLCFALQLRAGRTRLMQQEKIGAWLLLAGLLTGLRQTLPPLADIFAALAVLVFPGQITPAVAGLALAAGGAGLLPTAGLALCGFAANLPIFTRRWQRAAAFFLSATVAWLFARTAAPQWVFCASLAYILIPEKWLSRAPEAECAPDQLAREITAESSRRLRALGDAFGEMADRGASASYLPDEQELILEMRSRLCTDCPSYADCWAGSSNHAARFLCALIGEALDRANGPSGSRVLFADGEIPPDVLRACRRGRLIPDRLGLLLLDFSQRRRSEIKRCATDQLLSLQFAQAREILYDLAGQQGLSGDWSQLRLDQLRSSLEAEGLGNCGIFACSGEVRLSRPEASWTPAEARRAAHALARSFGGRFSPELRGEVLYFTREPRLRAELGACCQSGIAGQICGDSHRIERSGNRLYLLLSDGMGSGDAAAEESQQAVDLLWRFLEAGISRPLALETVNQQLLLRNPEDMFATVDLCCIDLNTGVAELTKLAACRTLILRGGEILPVEGGQLPLGILEGIQPRMQRIRLRPGDLLVMGSDGVMEAGDGLFIERLARANQALPAEQLAEELVRQASLRREGSRQDDLTCICLRLRDSREKPEIQTEDNAAGL